MALAVFAAGEGFWSAQTNGNLILDKADHAAPLPVKTASATACGKILVTFHRVVRLSD
jgi:hypothetical protein